MLFILACIITNTVVLATHHFNISATHLQINESINTFFVVVFVIEAAMKIVSQRTDYFRDSWNRFDFVILLLSFIMYIPA